MRRRSLLARRSLGELPRAFMFEEVPSMASKRLRQSEMSLPPGADDFKLINGIGPGVAQRLYNADILTFAQLADLSLGEIASLVADLAGLSAERIAKQDWSGQARDLALEQSTADQS